MRKGSKLSPLWAPALAVALLSGGGCEDSIDSGPSYNVDRLRILAISADPPETNRSGGSILLRALAYDPGGAPMIFVWLPPFGWAERETTGGVDIFDGFTVGQPFGREIAWSAGGEFGVFRVAVSAIAGDRIETAFKRINIYDGTKTEEMPDHNPVIEEITTASLRFPVGSEATFSVAPNYPDIEELDYNWYTTAGRLLDSETERITYQFPATADIYPLTCVVRTNHGGLTFIRRDLSVDSEFKYVFNLRAGMGSRGDLLVDEGGILKWIGVSTEEQESEIESAFAIDGGLWIEAEAVVDADSREGFYFNPETMTLYRGTAFRESAVNYYTFADAAEAANSSLALADPVTSGLVARVFEEQKIGPDGYNESASADYLLEAWRLSFAERLAAKYFYLVRPIQYIPASSR